MTKLTIVGGTEHTGEGPPVWEADDGVERVLRTGIAEDLSDVVIIGLSKSNTVFVALRPKQSSSLSASSSGARPS